VLHHLGTGQAAPIPAKQYKRLQFLSPFLDHAQSFRLLGLFAIQ
jgi:hypothetical protein